MADQLYSGLGVRAAILTTDILAFLPVAGPPAQQGDVAKLIVLLNSIYAPITGGAYVLKSGDTMTGPLLFSADNTIDIGASGATRPRTGYFGTSAVTPLLNVGSTLLTSDAANFLAQRNGANAQSSRIYFNYTDAANYERWAFDTSTFAGNLGIAHQVAGTFVGMTRNLELRPSNGLLIAAITFFSPDNTYDIGLSGALRPRNLFLSGGITTGSTTLHTTSVALTNGAAADLGTLTNAPVAGNPTKWVPVNDNGTTRYTPMW